nr:hypothetical protein [Tanacetum cinerariifolium]
TQAPRNPIGGVDAHTRIETTSKRSSDPPLSTGHTVRSGKDMMEQGTDLMDFVPPTPYDSPFSGGVLPWRKQRLHKTRSITTLQPLPNINPKDKGKGVLVEEELEKLQKVKRMDQGLAQIKSDADLAQKIYEKELVELDIAQKERKKQEEATIAALTEEFDEIQAKMDVDHELAKQLAAERAEAIRNKPPTRTQVRNRMITYLKHMYDFVPMDFKKEEKKSVEPKSKDKKCKRIKRVADSAPKHKSSKKQKMMQEQESAKSDEEESANHEQENKELRMWLTVISDEEETVDPEILSTKYGEGNDRHESPCEQKVLQKGPDEAKANPPPKVLRKDHVASHLSQSTLGGKSLAAMGIGTGSTVSAPVTQ